jgi:hypothetical protein
VGRLLLASSFDELSTETAALTLRTLELRGDLLVAGRFEEGTAE